MKLQNNLYTITDTDTAANAIRIALEADNCIYKAHFPGQPITPGVCIIQIATELFSCLMDCKLELIEVVNAKFLAVINPLETPAVEYKFSKITVDDAQQTVKVAVTVSSPATVCAKLSLLYKKA